MQCRNLLANDRVIRSLVNIYLGPMSVVFGDVGIGEDSFNGTLWNAGIAIDAGVSVYVKAIR